MKTSPADPDPPTAVRLGLQPHGRRLLDGSARAQAAAGDSWVGSPGVLPSGKINSLLLNMAIEIVYFPIKHGDFPVRFL